MKFNRWCVFLSFILGMMSVGCGVKGKPQPPLDPPLLGRGEPVFTEATQDIHLKKKPSVKLSDDWDDPKDFSGGSVEEK